MPNHIHLVISVGTHLNASDSASTPTTMHLGCLKPKRHEPKEIQDFHYNSSLSVIIRSLKGGVTRDARATGLDFAWQPRFHEHIIRNKCAYDNIMEYIDNNVKNWFMDCFYIGEDALKSVPTA